MNQSELESVTFWLAGFFSAFLIAFVATAI